MRLSEILFISVFLAALALPPLATYLGFAPPTGLFGVAKAPPDVPLAVGSYLRGEFQQAFEQRFDAGLGYRGDFVRTDNELNLRAFRQLGTNPSTSVILGKNGFFLEREYVNALNGRDTVAPSVLDEKVRRLKLLQDQLAAKGAAMLVVISTNKPFLYPENIPDKYIARDRKLARTNYAHFVRLLNEYGVHFIDAQAYLSEQKSAVPYSFFANSASHWNDPAACQITSLAVASIARQLQARLPGLRCDRYDMLDIPKDTDTDMLQVCNLWSEKTFYQKTPYTRSRLVRRGFFQPPSVLIIGSSFTWAILGFLDKHRISTNTFFRYYSSRHIRGKRTPIDKAAFDWENEVFSKQAVVFEVNAAVVHEVGWGFLEDAERFIRSNTPGQPESAK